MENWTAGYVADIGYTFGYYQELNPDRIKIAFLNAGLVYPECANACELGFGQGISINIHAAASDKFWCGTDFNPSQASYAINLAKNNSKVILKDEAFNEFCNRDDLPDFDFIAMHGIWSWINDENRKIIVDFLKRKLKVGGVLYVSYNTLPGWASFAPVRHLMTQHSSVMSAKGQGIVNRVEASIEYVKNLNHIKPLYLQTNTTIEERFNKLEKQNRQYLAHEYFNLDWSPMYFSEMSELLESAKLDFACSANYLDHIDVINLNEQQIKYLNSINDRNFKETTRDYLVNQQFRKDYWVKGKINITSIERIEKFRNHKIILIVDKKNINYNVNGMLGQAELTEKIYLPIVNLLYENGIMKIGKIEEELVIESIGINQIIEVVMVLIGKGYIATVQTDEIINSAQINTDLINKEIMLKARYSDDISYLASPVTGGGIPIGRFNQLFLLAYVNGKQTAEDWANFVWEILTKQGQKLIKEGKVIENENDNKTELIIQANEFMSEKFDILKELKIV